MPTELSTLSRLALYHALHPKLPASLMTIDDVTAMTRTQDEVLCVLHVQHHGSHDAMQAFTSQDSVRHASHVDKLQPCAAFVHGRLQSVTAVQGAYLQNGVE